MFDSSLIITGAAFIGIAAAVMFVFDLMSSRKTRAVERLG